uniref:Uncharacterized protein n=1 Tax=Salvator merianae TaxID=96440 RepID=A0A8D0DTI0_SALMN
IAVFVLEVQVGSHSCHGCSNCPGLIHKYGLNMCHGTKLRAHPYIVFIKLD